jgi:Polysaccharide lyase
MLTSQNILAPGGEAYVGWSVYLPSSNIGQWPGQYGDWNLINEFLQNPGGATSPGPVFQIGIDTASWNGASASNPHLYAEGIGGVGRWEDPATVPWDTWIDFVVHIKVASNPPNPLRGA